MRLSHAPRFWPIVALICVAVLRLVWTDEKRDSGFAFEVTAHSAEPHMMQLYFVKDDAAGFSEPASARVLLDSVEPKSYRFPLPFGNYRAFRLDPAQGPGRVLISSATVVDRSDGSVRCELPVSTWIAEQEISTLSTHERVLSVEMSPGAVDPILRVPLPTTSLKLEPEQTPRWIATIVVVALSVAALVWSSRRRHAPIRSDSRPESATTKGIRTLTSRFRAVVPPHVLPIDRSAALFLFCLIGSAVAATCFEIHGSSTTVRTRREFPSGDWRPLFGTAKEIRSDEWNVQTPTILHQINRADSFAIDSIVGPGNTILIANAPARHWSMMFRPQLLPFFVLSPEKAFAAYWQAKHVAMLGGTFLVFLLLVRSTPLAAFGAVWYHLSSYTQWAFSWPAPVPDMIGLTCLAVVLAALACTTPSRVGAAVFAALLVLCLLDFTFVAYPPFQVPIAWAGIGLGVAWLVSHRHSMRTAGGSKPPPRWGQGAITVGLATGASALVVMLFLGEIRPLIEITAQTSYPGNRSLSGGGVSWQQFLSAFVDPFKTESYSPPQFRNICEGSGFFWLAPITFALLLRGRGAGRDLAQWRAYLILWIPFMLLAAWMLLPIPAGLGRFLMLHMVMPWRVTPALGLINVALTLLFLSIVCRCAVDARRTAMRHSTAWAIGSAVTLLALLAWMNHGLHDFFSWPMLTTSAAVTGLATAALHRRSLNTLAVLVLVPLVWGNLLINPIDQGLGMYQQSAIRSFLDANPECKQGRWLVVVEDTAPAQYFAGLGLQVFNTVHFVPTLEDWRAFDPAGTRRDLYNGAGTAVVRTLPPGSPTRIEAIPESPLSAPIIKALSVAPTDPGLVGIGIRYFAVHRDGHPEHFPESHFEKLTPTPIDGFAIYRSRQSP